MSCRHAEWKLNGRSSDPETTLACVDCGEDWPGRPLPDPAHHREGYGEVAQLRPWRERVSMMVSDLNDVEEPESSEEVRAEGGDRIIPVDAAPAGAGTSSLDSGRACAVLTGASVAAVSAPPAGPSPGLAGAPVNTAPEAA